MPRFVLLDQSLRDFSGHHELYARQLLGAAQAAGFTPFLAANRRFGAHAATLPGVAVLAPFEHTTYCRYTLDDQAATRRWPWLDAPGSAWHTSMRERRMRAFAAGCAELCREIPLEPEDVVFAATVSELDFAGLARYLATDARARRARWHAQFHWSPFRPAAPAGSAEAVRRTLLVALAPLGEMSLRLHCTTEPLTRQYERLEVGPFHSLPYPIDEAIRPRDTRAEGEPARIVCLGHPRREKGRDLAPRLVRELWDDGLASGRARLVIQARAGTRVRLPHEPAPGVSPVLLMPASLPREQYVALVRDADIGLLLYDRERYLARCSGVLLELLAAGVPVVVPAGCWLADQVAEPAQAHLDALAVRGTALPLPARLAGDVAVGDEPLAVEVPLPDRGDVLLGFRWAERPPPGTYLRVAWRGAHDAQDGAAGASICGPRDTGRAAWVLARPGPGATALHVAVSNAYGEARSTLCDLTLVFLEPGGTGPSSAVGLIAAERSSAPAHVREVLTHPEHYRRSAVEHSRHVRERHAPAAVLRALLDA